jgi:putative FmdB family regulatory protein
MPIYEFRCVECGHIFEMLFVKSDDPAELECPQCHCHSVDRLLSKSSYTVGAGPGKNEPRITTKSCGSSNECVTLDLPGPSK